MTQRQIVRPLLAWFAETARDLPWRRTRDPYAIWVSEIMLQQTQVRTVIPYWERWMRQLPNIRALAKARPGKVHKLWEGLGYYTRVRNLQKAARVILCDHGGVFPGEFERVLELPGIGRYTAGAICSIAFGQPYPVLDGNVIRVLTRVFAVEGNPRESATNKRLWQLAAGLVQTAAGVVSPEPPEKLAPRKARARHAVSSLNQALMELGALVCTARNPQCDVCPLTDRCLARRENRVEDFPARPVREPPTRRYFAAFILERDGRFLVRQRPAGTINAHLWEFPSIELSAQTTDVSKAARRELGLLPVLHPFYSLRHTIMRFRITLDVFRVSFRNRSTFRTPAGGRWLKRAFLERLPFTSAHKKILLKLPQKLNRHKKAQEAQEA